MFVLGRLVPPFVFSLLVVVHDVRSTRIKTRFTAA